MPKFTTTIRIPSVTESDYQTVAKEMQKKQFVPAQKPRKGSSIGEKPFVFSHSGKESLFDLTGAVSSALEVTGKKFSFTIVKEKTGD